MDWPDYIFRFLKHDPRLYSPLYIQGRRIGRIAVHLEAAITCVSGCDVRRNGGGWWIEGGDEALDCIAKWLADSKLIPPLTGERYSVVDLDSAQAIATVDRSAAVWFGIRTEGVHLNAFVIQEEGNTGIWLARRSMTHRQFPGQLDNLVAGGLRSGCSAVAALKEEAEEEAGISAAMLEAARHVGALFYCFDTPNGLVDSEIQIFDLEVPASFVPRNNDGKVDSFLCVNLGDAERFALELDSFKFNCGLVLLDFIARREDTLVCADAKASVALLRISQQSTTLETFHQLC